MAKQVLKDTVSENTLTIEYAETITENKRIKLPNVGGEIVTDSNIANILSETDSSLKSTYILQPTGLSNEITNPEAFYGPVTIAPYQVSDSFSGEHTGTIWEVSLTEDFSNVIERVFNITNKLTFQPTIDINNLKYYVRYKYVSGNYCSPFSKPISLTTPNDMIVKPKGKVEKINGVNKITFEELKVLGTLLDKRTITYIKIYNLDGTIKHSVNISSPELTYEIPYGILEVDTKYILTLEHITDTNKSSGITSIEFTSAISPIQTPVVNYVLENNQHTLTTSEFVSDIPNDTHTGTTWVITDANNGNVILNTGIDSINKTKLVLTNFDPNKEYKVEVKHHSNVAVSKTYSYHFSLYLQEAPEFNITADIINNGYISFNVPAYTVPGMDMKFEYYIIRGYHPITGALRFSYGNTILGKDYEKTGFWINIKDDIKSKLLEEEYDLDTEKRFDGQFEWEVELKCANLTSVVSKRLRYDYFNGLTRTDTGLPNLTIGYTGSPKKLQVNTTAFTPKIIPNAITPKNYTIEVIDRVTNKIVWTDTTTNLVNHDISNLLQTIELNKNYKIRTYANTGWVKLVYPYVDNFMVSYKLNTPVLTYNTDNKIFGLNNIGWIGEKPVPNIITDVIVNVVRNGIQAPDIKIPVANINDFNNIPLSLLNLEPGISYELKFSVVSDNTMSEFSNSITLTVPLPAIYATTQSKIWIDNNSRTISMSKPNIHLGNYVCESTHPNGAHVSTSWYLYESHTTSPIWVSLKDTKNLTEIEVPETVILDKNKRYIAKAQFHSKGFGSSPLYETKILIPLEYLEGLVDTYDQITSVKYYDETTGGLVFNTVPSNLYAGTFVAPEVYLNGQVSDREYMGVWGYEPNLRKVTGGETGATAHWGYRKSHRVSIKGKVWDLYEALVDQPWGAFNPETNPDKWVKVENDQRLPSMVELTDTQGINWNVTDSGAAQYDDRRYSDGGWINDIIRNRNWVKIISPTHKKVAFITDGYTVDGVSKLDIIARENDYTKSHTWTVRFGHRLYYMYISTWDEIQLLHKAGYKPGIRSNNATQYRLHVSDVSNSTDTVTCWYNGAKSTTNIKTRAGHGCCWTLIPIDEKDAPYRKDITKMPNLFQPTIKPTGGILSTYNPWTDDGCFGAVPTTGAGSMPTTIVLNIRRKATALNEYQFPYYYMLYYHGTICYFPSHLTNEWNTTTVSGNFHFDTARAAGVAFDGDMGAYMTYGGSVMQGTREYRVANATMRRFHIMNCGALPAWEEWRNIENNVNSPGYTGDFKQPFTKTFWNTAVKLGGTAGGTAYFNGMGQNHCDHGGYLLGETYDFLNLQGIGANGIAVSTGTYNWPCGRDIVRYGSIKDGVETGIYGRSHYQGYETHRGACVSYWIASNWVKAGFRPLVKTYY